MTWVFIGDDMPVVKPPLPDDFGVGSDVIIFTQAHNRTPREGTVIKKGRIWITVALNTPSILEWKFRLDDQTDGSNTGFVDHFRTPEQQLHYKVKADAAKYLHTIGVRMEYGAPMLRGKIIELARLIHSSGLVPDVKP